MSVLLDQSKTQAFDFGPPVAKALAPVLLIHGFTGSPWELRLLGESLGAHGYHARGIRLPGHGTTPEEMMFVTWKDWLEATEREFLALASRGPICVAGHSMGALLAMLMAARHPDKVSSLVLMAPALKLHGMDAALVRKLRFMPLEFLRWSWKQKDTTDLENDEIRAESPITPRYPLSRLFDLFELQDLAAATIPFLKVQTLIAIAVNDHVVDNEGGLKLHRALPKSALVTLQRGFHIVARDNDRARLITEVIAFLDSQQPSPKERP